MPTKQKRKKTTRKVTLPPKKMPRVVLGMCNLLEEKNSSDSENEISEEPSVNDSSDLIEKNNPSTINLFNESLQNISAKRDSIISSTSLTLERKDMYSHLQFHN